jgi:hypothetical protein
MAAEFKMAAKLIICVKCNFLTNCRILMDLFFSKIQNGGFIQNGGRFLLHLRSQYLIFNRVTTFSRALDDISVSNHIRSVTPLQQETTKETTTSEN